MTVIRFAGRPRPMEVSAAAHPLPALSDRFVRKADDRKRRKARCNKNLHVDLFRVDALESNRGHLGEHFNTSTNIFNARGGYYLQFL